MAGSLKHTRPFQQTAFLYLCQVHGKKTVPVSCRNLSTLLQRNTRLHHKVRLVQVTAITPVRWNSSATQTASAVIDAAGDKVTPTDYIPPVPEAPVISEESLVPEVLNALGEPALSSLGLGNWTPSGLVQTALEAMHVAGLPWWSAIVIGTITLRMLMFPIVIKSQRNATHMHNCMPTMTRLQERFTQARLSGNHMQAARAGQELMDYMKRNNIKMLNNFLVPFAQMPVFLSVFFGLRGMANLPVESMKQGGLFWFTDLTLPDPFYALPLVTMATFLMTIELGVDGVKSQHMGHGLKWGMRAMPIIMLPFISNFPTAMLCYWFTSNAFSFLQVLFLKVPKVRDFFSIGQMVKHPPSALPKKKKFMEGFSESMNNAKMARTIEERQRLDALNFKQAGQGPIQKTYRVDPTKFKSPDATKPVVSAKPKS